MRFDEIELEAVPLGDLNEGDERDEVAVVPTGTAPLHRRGLALLTDLSLFAALVLALSPLLPPDHSWLELASLGGFVLVLSYYYFVGTWILWGKTIGGAIFDVRIIDGADGGSMSLQAASVRWAAIFLSMATCGIGFALASLPSRRSLSDRLSGTHCTGG